MRFLLLFLLPLVVFAQMQTRTQALMGTFVTITLPSKYNTQISDSFSTIKKIEKSLSSYDSEALVYKLNHTHKVSYDDYLSEAIDLSKQYYQDTHGYFDITIGSISKKLYRFGEENNTIPPQEALNKATLNIDAIYMTKTHISTEENITIDLGGMGKGYAVDKVVSALEEQNISQGTIALSGDIRCLDVCTFELQSPYSEQTFATLTAKHSQLSISTSGTYRRYVKSKEHHHLINPKTASQGKAFVSVSLFASANNTKIDAYATALSVMPKDKVFSFLKQHEKIGFMLVDNEGEISYGHLENFVTLTWLDYNEKTTSPNITINTKTKSNKDNSLIHPDTINPKEISK